MEPALGVLEAGERNDRKKRDRPSQLTCDSAAARLDHARDERDASGGREERERERDVLEVPVAAVLEDVLPPARVGNGEPVRQPVRGIGAALR